MKGIDYSYYYEEVESDQEEGTIIEQLVPSGTKIKEVLDKKLVIFKVAKKKSETPVEPEQPTQPEQPETTQEEPSNEQNP